MRSKEIKARQEPAVSFTANAARLFLIKNKIRIVLACLFLFNFIRGCFYAEPTVKGALFLAVILLCVYSIGKKFKDEQAGLLAAFIVGIHPLISYQSKAHILDLSPCVFASLGLWLLFYSDRLRDRFFTALYALCLAVGGLVKFSLLPFAGWTLWFLLKDPVAAAAFAAVKGFLKSKEWAFTHKKYFYAAFIVIALLVWNFRCWNPVSAFLWVVDRLFDTNWNFNHWGPVLAAQKLLGMNWIREIGYFFEKADKAVSLIFVWRISRAVFWILLTIFSASLISVLRSKYKYIVFWFLMALAPAIFFHTAYNFAQELSYIFGIYIFAALIAAAGLMLIDNVRLRRLLTGLILICGFLLYFFPQQQSSRLGWEEKLAPAFKAKTVQKPPIAAGLDLVYRPEGKDGFSAVKILYKNIPLTAEKGLCSYFRYRGRYYTFMDAVRRIESSAPRQLVLWLSWPDIQVSQKWELSLENGRLNWKVYLYNPRQLRLDDPGLEIRLVERYRFWQDYSQSGMFPAILPGHEESRRFNRRLPPGRDLVVSPGKQSFPGLRIPQNIYLENKESFALYSLILEGKKFRMVDFNLSEEPLRAEEKEALIFSGDILFFDPRSP